MYGDRWDFFPGPVKMTRYTDGTVLPEITVKVTLNGRPHGYFNVHMHRVKHPPHASVGFTSRVGPATGDVNHEH